MEKRLVTDFELASLGTPHKSAVTLFNIIKYIGAGCYFGVILVQSQVVSWFRIQEMFRFQSFHMYGVIGSAVVTGAISYWLIRKFNVRSIENETISVPRKPAHKGLVIGGLLFGVGWAFTGACPGPIFAQVGMGFGSAWVVLFSALVGTYLYGRFRHRLPH